MTEINHPQTLSEGQLLVLIWLSVSLVLLILLTRFGLRLRYQGRLLLDDYLLLAAFAVASTLAAMHNLSLTPLFLIRNSQTPSSTATIRFLRVQFAAKIMFWVNFYIVKSSLLAFLRTFLTALPSTRKYWYLAVSCVVIGMMASLLGCVTECTPVHRNFSLTDGCSGPSYLKTSRVVLTVLSVWDVLTDLVIIILPLPLLFSIRRSLDRWQLISLAALFSSGGLIIVFALLRLGRIWQNKPVEDIPWQITIAITWSQIEAAVAIFVGALPAFKIFLAEKSRNNLVQRRGRGQIGSLQHWAGPGSSQDTTDVVALASPQEKVPRVRIAKQIL